jgi:outer membrane protein
VTARRFITGAVALLATALAGAGEPLTLQQARATSLRMHPSITVAELRALAAHEVTNEVRAGYFPAASANATAVDAGETVTRLSSGSLTNSQIFDHVGIGAVISEVITDFGRTSNLTGAARFKSRAADANVQAVRAQILLAVDAAYFQALQAHAVHAVAAKILANRQVLLDQVDAMAKNQLKSDLDLRFARVGVSEARLLLDQADDDWQSALAKLASLMGQRALPTMDLAEANPAETDLPADSEALADLALRQRPELLRQRSEADAARDLAKAAHDARLPTVTALGAAGVAPVHDDHFEHTYAAVGVNLNVPLFAGGLYRAREREAGFEARDADAEVQEAEDNVVRDVRLAWLESRHTQQRIALTASLLENAAAARDLAQIRFQQGLTSIVELNQAELSEVTAEIGHTNAEFEYRIRRDILDFETGSLH